MSPINKKKLDKLRKKLDNLDNSFIKLIKKRTALVKQVLQLKESKSQIIDRKRIKFILNQIRKKSLKNKIDPKITNKPVIFATFNSNPNPISQKRCLISLKAWKEKDQTVPTIKNLPKKVSKNL